MMMTKIGIDPVVIEIFSKCIKQHWSIQILAKTDNYFYVMVNNQNKWLILKFYTINHK